MLLWYIYLIQERDFHLFEVVVAKIKEFLLGTIKIEIGITVTRYSPQNMFYRPGERNEYFRNGHCSSAAVFKGAERKAAIRPL